MLADVTMLPACTVPYFVLLVGNIHTNNGVIGTTLYTVAREGSGSVGKHSDPDPAKRYGSDRIRIRNTAAGRP